MGCIQSLKRRYQLDPKNHILNDYILMDIFDFCDIKDLFVWLRVSHQFSECIHRILKTRHQLLITESTESLCKPGKNKFFLRIERKYLIKNDHRFNNIGSAVVKKTDIYYLNQSIFTLKLISDKCQRIQWLALKDCFLDENSIEFIGENVKNLKVLVLIDCHLNISQIEVICKKLKNSMTKVTALKFDAPKLIGNSLLEDSVSCVLSIICSLENLKDLYLWVKNSAESSMIQKSVKLLPKLETLVLYRYCPEDINNMQNIREEFLNNITISDIKHLDIAEYNITHQMLKIIINGMNLEKFTFCCRDLNCNLLKNLAEKQQNLKDLEIIWSEFIGVVSKKNTFLFQKLKVLTLHCSSMSPNQFKHMIRLFPDIKKLDYSPGINITCMQNVFNLNCEICQNLCFDFIPRLDSLKKLSISFNSIRKSFTQCLHRFSNLKHIKLYNYNWDLKRDPSKLASYKQYFTQILNTLIDCCKQNPKRILKLEFESEIDVPAQLQLPRNLNLLKN